MRIYYSHLANTTELEQPNSVTIGNFDGCHYGHIALIKKNMEIARSLKAKSLVLSFDPNPKEFFRPNAIPGKIFQPCQKIRALTELGVDILFIQKFDSQFSQFSPEIFFKNYLADKLQARAIIVGHDFRFGVKRSGDTSLLAKLGRLNGIQVETVSPYSLNDKVVSSSLIRTFIQEGKIEEANQLLTRPYLLEGPVVHGQKVGRKIGFPTANIDVSNQLLPKNGVYCGFLTLADTPQIMSVPRNVFRVVINIGLRPTVAAEQAQPTVEAHILDEFGNDLNIYDRYVGLYLTDFIRYEQKFDSIDSLRNQIAKDKNLALLKLEERLKEI